MATKYIDGAYSKGFYLDPRYQILDIGKDGKIGGTGITTTQSAPSTIVNAGNVSASTIGITLADGGSVSNSGQLGNDIRSSEGYYPVILVEQAAGTIFNSGTISRADSFAKANDIPSGIVLSAGGMITNGTDTDRTARITGGIETDGAAGTVNNFGTVAGTNDYYFPNNACGYSVIMNHGGRVTNGSSTDQTALLQNGCSIAGEAEISNYGSIKSAAYAFGGGPAYGAIGYSLVLATGIVVNGTMTDKTASISGLDGAIKFSNTGTVRNYGTVQAYGDNTAYTGFHSLYGIVMEAGGTVTNGGNDDLTALISSESGGGVEIRGGSGFVRNFGTITATGKQSYDGVYGAGVSLDSGGQVINGTPDDKTATITGAVVSSFGMATVTNFGTITTQGSLTYGGVSLGSGGQITNGSADDEAATISGTVGMFISGEAKVTNFGTISGSGGTAVEFNGTGDVLVDEAGASFDGVVEGNGGTLRLARDAGIGQLTGLGTQFLDFASVSLESGADWALAQGNVLNSGGQLSLSGTLTNLGSLTLDGWLSVSAGGRFINGAADSVMVGDDTVITSPETGIAVFNYGTLTIDAGTLSIRDGLSSTGAITIAAPAALVLEGTGSLLGGTVAGDGSFTLHSSTVTLETGSAITVRSWSLEGTNTLVKLGAPLTYGGDFKEDATAAVDLDGKSFTLAAGSEAIFDGGSLAGSGSILSAGRTAIALLAIDGPLRWSNSGFLSDSGNFTLGEAHTVIVRNEAGGVFEMQGDASISGGTSLINDGLLVKTGSGTSVIGVALDNEKLVKVTSGTLDFASTVSGTGVLRIEDGSTIEADAAVSAGQTVVFQGTATLLLTRAESFAGTLSGFAAADTLDLRDFGSGTTISYSSGVLSVADGTLTANIALFGQYMAAGFGTSADGSGGTLVTYTPPAAQHGAGLAAGH
jgi:hypothetical protein